MRSAYVVREKGRKKGHRELGSAIYDVPFRSGVYTHVLNKGGRGVVSPLDRL